LLFTFTRQSAGEMIRRVDGLLTKVSRNHTASRQVWGGTFHAVAARFLRAHPRHIGLDPDFTIHDRSDSEDLLDVIRTELGLANTQLFPKKFSAMAIYSHCVNSRKPIDDVLDANFPWATDLKQLFRTYQDRKNEAGVLDYGDLLLFWRALLADEAAGNRIRQRNPPPVCRLASACRTRLPRNRLIDAQFGHAEDYSQQIDFGKYGLP
jgi:DNA helicase II / ATP-dependent DNA helicase PcrA